MSAKVRQKIGFTPIFTLKKGGNEENGGKMHFSRKKMAELFGG